VTFKDRPDIPTWHPSVKAFELLDRTGRHLAYFYFDPNPRVGKRTGAWNSDLISGGLLNGKVERPQVVNVTNFTPSTETAPSLLSLGEVTTLFHEMGHALHNMLSQAHYRSLFGTNVPWDFVELPSQLFENWALVPEVLDQYAHHYQTGERIPAALIEKAQKAANVGAAYSGVRQLFLASLDLGWYSQDIGDQTVEQFEDAVRTRFPILDGKGYSTSTSFSHIFAGGYSAGYYSYKWSEVLDADALEAFTENGMFDPHTAFLYQLHILEKGGSEAPDVLYRRFRGRDADPDAILRREGLAPAKPTEPTQLELPF
jgi:peptidyl-dipeptidase Dcp